MIGILEGHLFSEKVLANMKENNKVKIYDGSNLDSFLVDVDVLFVRLYYNLNKEFLIKAPKLKYICSPTTGLNHIDSDYCKSKGIDVISLKGEVSFLEKIVATPEHTFGLILALLRNYKAAFDCNTKKWNRDTLRGHEISNKKIGIIGFGRVGRKLFEYLECFGAITYAYDKNEIPITKNLIVCKSMEELLKLSEVIVLCANYAGEQIVNSNSLAAMKDKYFINTARGELVDEISLIELLNVNHFAGVALDVITNEASNNNMKIIQSIKHPNLIITPHIAGATFQSMEKTEVFIYNKLIREQKRLK